MRMVFASLAKDLCLHLKVVYFCFFNNCNCNLPVFPTEKAMAPHSSTLAWKIPWTEEPGRLQSMGSLRVGLDWATSLSLFTFMYWRRKWQPTPVFLPGEQGCAHSTGMGKPGGLLSVGSHRVGHDWSNLAAAAVFPSYFEVVNYLLLIFVRKRWKKAMKWTH